MLVALVALTGCNSLQPQINDASQATLRPNIRLIVHSAIDYSAAAVGRDYGKSWVSSDAERAKYLLYVSDQTTSDVYIYNYGTKALLGKLTGFNLPVGSCEDAEGDVWIANFGGQNVDEYAHGRSRRMKKLKTDGAARGCSIDPTTGNLAVSTDDTVSGYAGSIEIWNTAFGQPKIYTNVNCGYLWTSPGYDSKGNLYVQGTVEQSAKNVVCELPAGGTTLNVIAFDQDIRVPGGVMWDGKYITLTDADAYYGSCCTSVMYQAELLPSGVLKPVSKTILFTSYGGIFVEEPFVVGKNNTPANTEQGTAVVSMNRDAYQQVYFWSYPVGGDATSMLASPPNYASGQSVSIRE